LRAPADRESGVASIMGKNARIVAIVSGFQLLVTLLLAVTCWYLFDERKAFSVLLGGGICALVTLLLGIKIFARGVVPTQEWIRRFYVGEIQKLVLIAVFLALIFRFLEVDALFVFCALLIAQMVNLFALPFLR